MFIHTLTGAQESTLGSMFAEAPGVLSCGASCRARQALGEADPDEEYNPSKASRARHCAMPWWSLLSSFA